MQNLINWLKSSPKRATIGLVGLMLFVMLIAVFTEPPITTAISLVSGGFYGWFILGPSML